MARIDTKDGTKIWYQETGPADGRSVILIHGWPLSSATWDPVMIKLGEAGYRTIAYDRRGFGRSDHPGKGYDYDTMADDLAALMEATGATEDVTIAGFSMGGGEVARYMSRHGGKGIRSAALISSVVPYLKQSNDNPDGVPEADLKKMAEGMKVDNPKFMKGFLKDFFGVGIVSHTVSDEILHWAWLLTQQAELKATLDCAGAFAETDFRPDLASFNVPTLIIHGTADHTVPIDPTGRAAAAGIAGSEVIEYDGEPHGLFVTARDRLIDDLLAFLKR